MDLGISRRTAIVAGAGRGIGRAVALALAKEGVDVALLARNEGELSIVADEARALGVRALSIPADATDRRALEIAVDRTSAELGPPTILILAIAALYAPQKLQFVDADETRRLFDTDVVASVDLCRLALPSMMDARFGRIVAIGSVAARAGVAGGALYSAGKAALEGLVRGISVDYARRGITANVVAVSFAETERLRGRLEGDEAARDRLVRATSTRRLPTADEIADVVAFLCSQRASVVTGAVVDATAGAHLNNLW